MQSDAAPATGKRTPAWKLALNLALFVGLVGVFAWQVMKSRKEIAAYHWTINWELTGVALLLLLVCSTVDILIWNRTLGWFTDPLPFRQAAPVYIWSYIARYIPGKVGSLILRAALATQVKREPVPVLASSTVELGLRLGSGAFLFVAVLFGWGFRDVSPIVKIASLLIVPLALICAHPKVMLPVMNWGLRKIKQQQLQRPLGYGEVLGVFCALLIRWVLYGFSYAVFAAALFPNAMAQTPVLIGLASGAWVIGFLSGMPGGTGLAELTQATILATIGFPVAIVKMLPILARLLTLVGEGLWSLAAWGFWARRSKTPVMVADEAPVAQ